MKHWARVGGIVAGLWLCLIGLEASVWGQSEGTGDEPRYSESVNVDEFGPPPEAAVPDWVSAPLMVTLAYGFIWLLATGFMWSIWRRSRALQAEIRSAQRRLDGLDKRLGEGLRGDSGRT